MTEVTSDGWNIEKPLFYVGISKYILEIADDFQVFGERDELWEEFQLNIDYNSFVIKPK